MNALELASMIDLESSSIPFDVDDVSSMLRRQHEAIVKLRSALESVERRSRWSDSYINDVAEKALKDTEEFK